jgi:DNA-binding cell septation regulator SpoVG
MFYIVETNYAGPNPDDDRYIDSSTIAITTSPAIRNGNCEICLDGWCGNSGDWVVHAHGEYSTIEKARAALADRFGEVRDSDPAGESFRDEYEDLEVVEVYKAGKYSRMSSRATGDWAYEWIQRDIKADTSDKRINALVEEYEAEANTHGGTLHGELEQFMQVRRQELRDELEFGPEE